MSGFGRMGRRLAAVLASAPLVLSLTVAAQRSEATPLPHPNKAVLGCGAPHGISFCLTRKPAVKAVEDRTDGTRLADRGHARIAAKQAAARQTATAAVAFPSYCQVGVQYISLVESCSVFAYTIDIEEDAKPVGFINLNVRWYSYGDITSTTYNNQWAIEWVSAGGKYTDNYEVSAEYKKACSPIYMNGSCPITTTGLMPYKPFGPYSSSPTGSGTVTANLATGNILVVDPKLDMTFASSYAPGTRTVTASTTGWKCDRALPGNNNTAGCRIDRYVPVKTYYRYGAWPAFADHVSRAQASGLLGAPSYNSYGYAQNALNRVVNPTTITTNRSRACKSSYPRPTGKSCDEYPFASSDQGAGSTQGAGGPRTFSGCSISGVGSATGPSGFSVCMIVAKENSDAGTDLNSFYTRCRVLYSGAFFVAIINSE